MPQSSRSPQNQGFTLIELLIVIAIIAILALIAVPNFLEAQMRAKLSRIENDLRVLATAMETYYSDWTDYPERSDEGVLAHYGGNYRGLLRLSTPLAYLSRLPLDPFEFETGGGENWTAKHHWLTYELASTGCTDLMPKGWAAYSCGPDRNDDTGPGVPLYPNVRLETIQYSATNGTMSVGDLLRFGPQEFKNKIRYKG